MTPTVPGALPTTSTDTAAPFPAHTPVTVGWRCPVCGAGNAPTNSRCACALVPQPWAYPVGSYPATNPFWAAPYVPTCTIGSPPQAIYGR